MKQAGIAPVPAPGPALNVNVRVALLARTSTEDQQDPTISIPRQLRNCENALPDGAVIVAYFYDVESGRKDLTDRGRGRGHEHLDIPVPRDGGIQDLLAEAEGGVARFDAVICESVDRIARRTYYGTLIEHRLERAGIPLLASDEPIVLSGRSAQSATQILTRRVKQGVAEWYVLDMLEKAWGGFEEHTRQGFNVGQPPYGYAADKIPHPVPARRAEGKSKSRLMIEPTRAFVVQRIFEWRAFEHLGYKSIATRLNTDLVLYPPPVPPDPARALGRWTPSSVRDVINNPKYIGHMVWNRRATKSAAGRCNKPDEWVWSPEPTHPAIVSVELFTQAGAVSQRTSRSRATTGNNPQPDTTRSYPLRSFIYCAQCQRAMFGKVRHGNSYYACIPDREHRPDGHAPTLYVREEPLLDGINRFFLARIFGEERESLLYALMDRHEQALAAEQEQRTTVIEKGIADVDARRARQIRALELADDGDQAFVRDVQARVAELSTERSALAAKLAQLNETRRPLTDPTLIRGLPIGAIDLVAMSDGLRRRLFEMFRLKISFDKVRNRADCTVTITPGTLPKLQKLLAATATTDLKAPLTSGVNNAKMDTTEENASSVPIWKVPPVGFEPTHPPPER